MRSPHAADIAQLYTDFPAGLLPYVKEHALMTYYILGSTWFSLQPMHYCGIKSRVFREFLSRLQEIFKIVK